MTPARLDLRAVGRQFQPQVEKIRIGTMALD
jgi:hypothetical protein